MIKGVPGPPANISEANYRDVTISSGKRPNDGSVLALWERSQKWLGVAVSNLGRKEGRMVTETYTVKIFQIRAGGDDRPCQRIFARTRWLRTKIFANNAFSIKMESQVIFRIKIPELIQVGNKFVNTTQDALRNRH